MIHYIIAHDSQRDHQMKWAETLIGICRGTILKSVVRNVMITPQAVYPNIFIVNKKKKIMIDCKTQKLQFVSSV